MSALQPTGKAGCSQSGKKGFTQTRRPVSRKISVFVEHQPKVELEELLVQVRSQNINSFSDSHNR